MRLYRLRQKAHAQGLVLLQFDDRWLITNQGNKYLKEKEYATLKKVEKSLDNRELKQ